MVRKPGHAWFDFEVIDVFGSELGEHGLVVYMVLARHCYDNYRVTAGLRNLAEDARVSKDTVQRSLRRLIEIGLVVEVKGRTEKTRSTYYLVDAKELAKEFVRTRESQRPEIKTVSVGDTIVVISDPRVLAPPQDIDRAKRVEHAEDTPVSSLTLLEAISSQGAVPEGYSNCLPQRQWAREVEPAAEPAEKPVDKSGMYPLPATEVSQTRPHSATDGPPTATEVSHTAAPFNNKNQEELKANNPDRDWGSGLSLSASAAVEEPTAAELADLSRVQFRQAADKVMRECVLAGPLLTAIIERTLRAAGEQTDELPNWNAIAERMAAAWSEYRKYARAGLLRITYQAPNFFQGGIWRDDSQWCIDEDKLRTRQRVMVGSGKNIFGEEKR